MLDRVRRVLREAGLRPGDRVATLLPNSLELLSAYYAALLDGLVVVPVSVRLSAREIAAVLGHSGSACVLLDAGSRSLWTGAVAATAASPVVLGDVRDPMTSDAGAPLADPCWPADHPAVLFYTSGSTGRPKGVLYTHGTLTRNCAVYGGGLGVTADDRAVLCHCLASNFVFAQLTVPFLAAGASVDVVGFGDVDQTLGAIRDGATFLSLIPWFGYALIDAAAPADRSNRLRVAQIGGDSIPPDYYERFRAAFGIHPRQMIGMTETNTYATNPLTPDDLRLEACGRPLPGVSLQIRGRSGRVLPAGREGEIWVRTPGAMAGYWRDPALTRRTVVDGWVRTGDAGYLDADGYLWFAGRLRHIIIHDGDNIHPREIEIELMRHPAIREACVFGVPDARHGEAIAAALVPGDRTHRIGRAELSAFLDGRLAAGKVPEHLVHVDALPRTRAGKLDRARVAADVLARLSQE